jgi:hypothetical protein
MLKISRRFPPARRQNWFGVHLGLPKIQNRPENIGRFQQWRHLEGVKFE